MAEFQAFMQGVMAQQMQQNEVLKNIMEMVTKNKEGDGEKRSIEKHWEELKGKSFEVVEKFKGGEAEWHEWSGDFMNLVTTKCEGLGEAMALVKNMAKGEKEVMKTQEVLEALMEDVVGVDEEAEAKKRYGSIGHISK